MFNLFKRIACKHEIVNNGFTFVKCRKCGTIRNNSLAVDINNVVYGFAGTGDRFHCKIDEIEDEYKVKILMFGRQDYSR